MDIFHHHPLTGELLGSGVADPDPLEEGAWLLPANATTISPPASEEGKARVFSQGTWVQIDDHRGETWWDVEGNPIMVADLGDPTDDGLTDVEPEAETIPLSEQVNIERDRRIEEGSTFTVTNHGNVSITGSVKDMTILTALLVKAQGLKAAGVTTPSLVLRDKDNTTHTLTPDQMIELVTAGMTWIEDTMQVSWAMKDGIAPFEAGIPADFATNESYWP